MFKAAGKASVEEVQQLEHKAAIDKKYRSIDSLQNSDKITALKNPKLNPYRLANPYDGLSTSMEKWKTVANDAVLTYKDQATRDKVAGNYYDKMIAPFYGALGLNPMPKERWISQAYKEGVEYDINRAYEGSIIHALKHGWDSGIAATARATGFLSDMTGEAIHDAMQIFRQNTKTSGQLGSWHEQLSNLHNLVAPKGESFLEKAKKDTAEIPFLNAVSRGARIQDANHEFYADSYPTFGGWKEHATSFVVEQAAQLPVWIALGGLGKVANVTKALSGTKIGSKAIPYLMAGGEGLAYGTLTRQQEDKGQAWRDAVGFMVFHGLFDVAGMGGKKLIDMVPEGKVLDALKKKQDRLDLAQEGKRPATGEERYAQHKKEVANNLAVVGIPGQRAIYADALSHVSDMENRGWSKQEIKDHEMTLLKADPARFSPVFSAASYVRSLLGDNRLNNIAEGSDAERTLSAKLAQLIVDAGSEMQQHVEGFKEEALGAAAEATKEPAAKDALDVYRARVLKQVADAGATQMVKPEQIEEQARKLYAEDSAKAAELTEKKLNENPTREIENVSKKIKKEKPMTPETKVSMVARTQRRLNKFGEPSVSYSVNSDYKSYLKNVAKDSGMNFNSKNFSSYLKSWFQDLDEADFHKDLVDYFYPESLKKAGVFFEKSNTPEGTQNPNFLAFMYNYLDQMPKELGEELENRLSESMKVQKYMSGRMPSDPQLMYYAKAMYNHVDNFLGSGRWPKETNIFRSSNANMWKPTKWQKMLLIEKTIQERQNLKEAFGSNKKAMNAALTAHKVLAEAREKEFDAASQKMSSQQAIQDLDTKISDLQTESGDFERIPF